MKSFQSSHEIFVPWKGRLSFKQYMPSKRDRFGINNVTGLGISGFIITRTILRQGSYNSL